jgi:hypothetical protein
MFQTAHLVLLLLLLAPAAAAEEEEEEELNPTDNWTQQLLTRDRTKWGERREAVVVEVVEVAAAGE